MKYYFIVGEASGDLHGSNLIKALKEKDSHAKIRAWGGDLMATAGAKIVKHYRDLAFMGFVEVALNLRTILKNLGDCKRDIESYQPDVLVLIDYPGFNLRIADWAKKQGIKVLYYISPQIWAWKQSRVHKIKRDVGKMLTILPFEQDFYASFNVEVDFVGHPLLDAIQNRPQVDREERLRKWGLNPDKPLIALLPGSRKQEIQAMLPLMIRAVEKEGLEYLIAGAPSQELDYYQNIAGRKDLPIVFGRTYAILEVASAALVTSGTATLETALFGVPEVVCYKSSWLSYQIAKKLVKVDYISLVNLVMERMVVKELIQADFNEANLRKELEYCLSEEGRQKFTKDYKALAQKLGGPGASDKAAKITYHYAAS